MRYINKYTSVSKFKLINRFHCQLYIHNTYTLTYFIGLGHYFFFCVGKQLRLLHSVLIISFVMQALHFGRLVSVGGKHRVHTTQRLLHPHPRAPRTFKYTLFYLKHFNGHGTLASDSPPVT